MNSKELCKYKRILTEAYERATKFSTTNGEGGREHRYYTREVKVHFTLVKEENMKILKTVKKICLKIFQLINDNWKIHNALMIYNKNYTLENLR